jgi:hypothetical protein
MTATVLAATDFFWQFDIRSKKDFVYANNAHFCKLYWIVMLWLVIGCYCSMDGAVFPYSNLWFQFRLIPCYQYLNNALYHLLLELLLNLWYFSLSWILSSNSVSVLALWQVYHFISAENLPRQKEEGPKVQESEQTEPGKFVLVLLKHFAYVCSNCA